MALLVQSVCGGKKANANHFFFFFPLLFFLKHMLEQDGQKPLHILAHTPAKSSQMHTFSNAHIYSPHTVQGKTTNCSTLTHRETNRSQLFSNKKLQVLASRQLVTHTDPKLVTHTDPKQLTRVWVPGAARDFSPRVNLQCRLSNTNSKHWFTTSFLQPLPYSVMP